MDHPGGSEALICNGAKATYGTERQVELTYNNACCTTNLPNIHSFLLQAHASPKLRICTTNIIRSRILTVDELLHIHNQGPPAAYAAVISHNTPSGSSRSCFVNAEPHMQCSKSLI